MTLTQLLCPLPPLYATSTEDNNKCQRGCEEARTLYNFCGKKSGSAAKENSMVIPRKIKNGTTI